MTFFKVEYKGAPLAPSMIEAPSVHMAARIYKNDIQRALGSETVDGEVLIVTPLEISEGESFSLLWDELENNFKESK